MPKNDNFVNIPHIYLSYMKRNHWRQLEGDEPKNLGVNYSFKFLLVLLSVCIWKGM